MIRLFVTIGLVIAAGLPMAGPIHGESLPASIDYLYIESNAGGASGGHAALRVADQIYHFEFADSDMIEISRVDSDLFLRQYALYENRDLHVSRIAVSEETQEAVRQAFNQRFLIQQAQLAHLASLRADRDFLAALIDQVGKPADAIEDPHPPMVQIEVHVPGSGYFLDPHDPGRRDSPAVSPALERLRHRIQTERGEDFLPGRIRALREGLIEIRSEAPIAAADRPSPDRLPPIRRTLAVDLDVRTRNLVALEILEARPRLDARAILETSRHREFVLGDEERQVLGDVILALETQLVRLIDSPRDDWGTPLLLGMARLAALERSVALGRFVFLDAYPDSSDEPETPPKSWFDVADRYERHRHADFEFVRRQFFAKPILGEAIGELGETRLDEGRYTRLEDHANRWLEMQRAIRQARLPRYAPEYLVAEKSAAWLNRDSIELRRDALDRQLASVREAEAAYEDELRRIYHYDVIAQNCVSAIFDVLDHAVIGLLDGPPAVAALEAEARHRLGGHLDPKTSLAFIPVVSNSAVRKTYRVVDEIEVESYRGRRLREMYAAEPDWRVYLRESNTLTSTAYAYNDLDSFFLFFTDDVVVTRPLYGAFNLAAAIGQTVLGLFQLPFDGGKSFVHGLRGGLYSLPELAFVSIRKGSIEVVPEDVDVRIDPEDGGLATRAE